MKIKCSVKSMPICTLMCSCVKVSIPAQTLNDDCCYRKTIWNNARFFTIEMALNCLQLPYWSTHMVLKPINSLVLVLLDSVNALVLLDSVNPLISRMHFVKHNGMKVLHDMTRIVHQEPVLCSLYFTSYQWQCSYMMVRDWHGLCLPKICLHLC